MKKILLLLLLMPQLVFAGYTCSRFQLPGWWGTGDYLLLWRKKRFYPPLVTTNDDVITPALGQPGTRILFGDEEIGGHPKSGGRVDFGIWLSRCLGMGGGGFGLGKEEVDFELSGASNGFPIIGRPFFDLSLDAQNADFISFPDVALDGEIKVETTNYLWGADAYVRYRYLSTCCFKFDFLAGFLFTRIVDNLDIHNSEVAGSIAVEPEGTLIIVDDHFECKNDYYAGLVGFVTEWRSCAWAVQVIGKVGLGNMIKQVDIAGETTLIDPAMGSVTVLPGGLLAQPSNIGKHSLNQFEIIPQINANLQFQILPPLWLKVGYTYMFWPRIALAGEQVDLNVNLTQINPPFSGTLGPLFDLHDKSFWVQGLTAGFYIYY